MLAFFELGGGGENPLLKPDLCNGCLVSAFQPHGSVRTLLFQQGSSFAETTTVTYNGSKLAAGRYQRALRQFVGSLHGAGLGVWHRKPPEPAQLHQ